MERRRFSQTMASEWQTAFVISHKMLRCALLTAVKNYNKSLEKLQDFFFKTETKTKTYTFIFVIVAPRESSPRPWSRGQHHWLELLCTLKLGISYSKYWVAQLKWNQLTFLFVKF